MGARQIQDLHVRFQAYAPEYQRTSFHMNLNLQLDHLLDYLLILLCTDLRTYVGVCGYGGYVNATKRGHTYEISQKTEDTFHTVDGPRFGGLQNDGNDVKMLFRP